MNLESLMPINWLYTLFHPQNLCLQTIYLVRSCDVTEVTVVTQNS